MGHDTNGSDASDAMGRGAGGHGRAQSGFEELRRALAGQSFASIEEAQAVLDRITYRKNHTPVDDFAGLSPEQMHRMLHFPFDSPRVAIFFENLPSEASAPILTLFHLLAEGIGDGLKPTATGNLPRSLVQSAALTYWGEEIHRERTRYGAIRTEPDFKDLHVTRIVAEIAGLVRKYKGKLIFSRKARKLLDRQGAAGVYPVLLRAYTGPFNWGYRDRYEDLGIVQQSFLFSMYLVHRFGEDWREVTFYEDAFVRAFPMALNMIGPNPYTTPERYVGHCYALRSLVNFLAFFGLVETEPAEKPLFDRIARVRKAALLDQVVTFPT